MSDLLTRIAEVERLEKEWLAADQLHDRLARISTDRADTKSALRRCVVAFHTWQEAKIALFPELAAAYRKLIEKE